MSGTRTAPHRLPGKGSPSVTTVPAPRSTAWGMKRRPSCLKPGTATKQPPGVDPASRPSARGPSWAAGPRSPLRQRVEQRLAAPPARSASAHLIESPRTPAGAGCPSSRSRQPRASGSRARCLPHDHAPARHRHVDVERPRSASAWRRLLPARSGIASAVRRVRRSGSPSRPAGPPGGPRTIWIAGWRRAAGPRDSAGSAPTAPRRSAPPPRCPTPPSWARRAAPASPTAGLVGRREADEREHAGLAGVDVA